MKIKQRSEILHDIIRDAKKVPTGWTAAFGKDPLLSSHDYYILHPDIGLYLLKEVQKNPYQIKGIGTKISRRTDDNIIEKINEKSGDFGIIQVDFHKIFINLKKGIQPEKIFEEGINGKDLGITIPVRGKASTSQQVYEYLKENYRIQQKPLHKKMGQLLSDEGISTGYD